MIKHELQNKSCIAPGWREHQSKSAMNCASEKNDIYKFLIS